MQYRTVCLLFFSLQISGSTVIDLVFTVKNLADNDRLQESFLTMITSLFEHTSINNLRLHVIADSSSQQFVDQTLKTLHYHSQVIRMHSIETYPCFRFCRSID